MDKPDIIICAIIGLYCIIGFARGVIRQFFSIAAFIIASASSIIVPLFVKLPEVGNKAPLWGHIIFSALIWVPVFLVFNGIGKFIAKRMSKKGIKFSDRIWGFFFGGIKGLIIITIAAFIVDILPSGVRKSIPLYNDSRILSSIRLYNPIIKLQVMQNLQAIASVFNDPDYMELLSSDAGFQRIRKNENIKSILDDPDLIKTISSRQYLKFMTHPSVQAVINDEEALGLLLSTDIDNAVIKSI